ncbi:MAG: type II toxin-antitoxin system HicA family toxin [Chloroflexi bacterium]|nr:type II toxin-antitoxin system HicA family toxin [Chloroflexota bacterium]MCI0855951.1 type II toxin-antitoxin system HicA family toxin [Chloroflexota bacterium]MCI0890448.1 type II toxin-antitoxin system HicA family toxin [Chloroflexota bacterium]
MEKAATDAGWMLRRTTGSHAIYKKDGARRPLAIPIHARAMKRGLALDLIKTIRDSL